MDPICTNRQGDVFVAFHGVSEGEVAHFEPLTHAVVVAWHGGRVLLMFNRRKDKWEVPGGRIDPGETPRETAHRELLEETGQRATLHFAGVMEVQLKPDHQTEFGAVFVGDLQGLSPFTENEEAFKIHLWDGTENIGYVDEFDRTLVGWYRSTRLL